MTYIAKRCVKCGDVRKVYHNVKRCRQRTCNGDYVECECDEGCCPTCGKPLNPSPRICGRCGKQITSGHKWYVSGSTIFHRNCDDPNSYKGATKK